MNLNLPESIESSAQEIVNLIQERKLAIVCGAGISITPPSNLPSARDLRMAIIRKIINVGSLDTGIRISLEDGVIKEKGIEASIKNEANKYFYPFESFIQTVDENAPILDTLVELFKLGEPNKNHTLFAELIKKGYVKELFTTNFDSKIEEALELHEDLKKFSRRDNFKVLSSESEFKKVDWGLNVPVIYKVHGTVSDKNSIRTTLVTVSRRELVEARVRVIRHFFQESKHDILILGYSASDEFDINPILRDLQSNNRIFMIKHLRKNSKENHGVFQLMDPFKGFKGKIIRCNTDDLVTFIWDRVVQKPWVKSVSSNEWKRVIVRWGKGLSKENRLFTAAKVLWQIKEYGLSERLCKQGLQIQTDLRNKSGIAKSLYLLAIIQENRSNHVQVKIYCEKSLRIRKSLGDKSGVAESLHLLAMVQQDIGNYDEAEKLCKKSLKIRENLGNQSGIAESLHQLASIQEDKGNYDEAEKLCKKSLKIDESLGNQSEIAMTLHLLAIIHHDRENYDQANELYRQSLRIDENLADQAGIAVSLHQLAMLQDDVGNYDEAEKLCKQSLKIEESLGNPSGIAESLQLLASIQEDKGNYDEAEKLCKKSLKIEESLGEKPAIAESFKLLASIQENKRNYGEAEKLLLKALDLYRHMGKKSDESIVERNLGKLRDVLNSNKPRE